MADSYEQLDDIMESLTGQGMEESRDDNAGTYFDRDHWVSADGIRSALIAAYLRGREDA